ncbi:MAG TPA: hypothetical protein VM487_18945 [Phycisphaerae bacterium]|nr:hypothetical protein [Phycisphaerae bacterium]
MRTDFENLEDGQRIVLYPNADNPLHRKPVEVTFQRGYFYSDSAHLRAYPGPDYYFGDVLRYNDGFTVCEEAPTR